MEQHIQRYYQLVNEQNMHVELCNFGARILSIKYPNADGDLVETTLNHDSIDAILNDDAYMGTTAGRVCNRISNASFEIDGHKYQLPANEGNNLLHGGADGFDKRIWKTEGVNSAYNSIQFSLTSADGDQGFPGELSVLVRYELTNNNELVITYNASTTKPTPINLCNHAYFNLGEEDVRALNIQINANEYLPVDNESIPLGNFENVQGTKFDLRQMTDLNSVLDSEGYDHCYKVGQSLCATVESKNTLIRLEIETDQLGVQFYTGNFLPNKQSALCLEAQGFPDAINHPELADDILRPGEEYTRRVVYRYSSITSK